MESYLDKNKLRKTGFDMFECTDADHGRIETRRCWVTEEIDWLEQRSEWSGLNSIGLIEYSSNGKVLV